MCIRLTSLSLLSLLLASAGAQEPQVYRTVTPERLEKVLADLKIKFEKKDGPKAGVHQYDYDRNDFKIRLNNYNGQDLWIESVFPEPLAPEKVNEWNVRAKFSRAVLLKAKDSGKPTVSVESQLDCLAGATDAIVRRFITRFDKEVGDFAKFAGK